MEKALFDKQGEELVAEVTCTPKCDGAYTLRVWEKGQNTIVHEWPGNFVNTDDDAYGLKLPNDVNDGRLVHCQATVAVPAGTRPRELALTIRQGDQELGRHAVIAKPGSVGTLVLMFIRLVAK